MTLESLINHWEGEKHFKFCISIRNMDFLPLHTKLAPEISEKPLDKRGVEVASRNEYIPLRAVFELREALYSHPRLVSDRSELPISGGS